MKYNNLGSTDIKISQLGFGTWQFANSSGSWVGSTKEQSQNTLKVALESGITFIDTALVYGDGLAEQWIGEVVNEFGREKVILASKIYAFGGWNEPNKDSKVEDFYPEEWIHEAVEASLKNLNTDYIDLMQFHVWNDVFANDLGWQKAVKELTQSGKVRSWGISLLGQDCEDFKATIDTGLIQSVQMIFNLFHQLPIDRAFEYLKSKNVSILARVPLDEGGLTGTLTSQTKFENGDFRAGYFQGDRLLQTVERVSELEKLGAEYGIENVVELALRFIISFEAVSSVIPGMRKLQNLEKNLEFINKGALPAELLAKLRTKAWERDFYVGAWG